MLDAILGQFDFDYERLDLFNVGLLTSSLIITYSMSSL